MKNSVYARPNKPRFITVTKRRNDHADQLQGRLLEIKKPLEIHFDSECHVTPEGVAADMVNYLEPGANDSILEPQAGTGALLRALIEFGVNPSSIHAVEREYTLCEILQNDFCGVNVERSCFLDYAENSNKRFSRIILNPPFKHVKKHMQAALSLLASGGVLVALVPVTYQHEDAIELEKLDADTFSSAKVYTKIIRIET